MDCVICNVKHSTMKRCVRCKTVYYCSQKCQIADWPAHREICSISLTKKQLVEERHNVLENAQTANASVDICIKCNRKKYKVAIYDSNPGKSMSVISKTLCIPSSKLKLIGRGMVINEENICDLVFTKKCRAFMAFGEEAEDETGLQSKDIDVVMQQLQVDRNAAVRGLRKCDGNIIDAILLIGSK